MGALFRVDPSSGTRTLLSDFGNAGQGPTGIDPLGVAVWRIVEPHPVGGVVMPVSKLELLAPYLALAGLIGAITATVTLRKKNKD